jgi:oxygen-independent coproporphyrinogen-3 oxidase
VPDSRQPDFAANVERLCREIDLVARLIERDREVVGLHAGIAEADAPWRLARFGDPFDALRHQFHFSTAATSEMTIHADPRVLRPGEIAMLAAAGFNRIAFMAGQPAPTSCCAAN